MPTHANKQIKYIIDSGNSTTTDILSYISYEVERRE